MKYFKEKATILMLAAIALFTLNACDNEDDIGEIFTGKIWTLTFIQTETERLGSENAYTLQFSNATFTFTTPDKSTISGSWYADGKSREFVCSDVTISGNILADKVAQNALDIFRKAVQYEGDANYIKIIEKPGTVYMQFYNR